MSCGSIRSLTTWMWMTSRVRVTITGLSMPWRLIVSVIGEFTGPRISRTASVSGTPSTVLPSIAVMMSPALIPALRGGRVVDRADHADQAAVFRHLDPEAAELAGGLHFHVAELPAVM